MKVSPNLFRRRLHALRCETLESRQLLSISPIPGAYTPQEVTSDYGIDHVHFGSVHGDGSGQTIAIVDAYDDPTIQQDVAAFDSQFGLPQPVLTVENVENGIPTTISSSSGYRNPYAVPPQPFGNWSSEISLDVEWAHAIAPGANLVLMEANGYTPTDLSAAINAARSAPGVSVVSMSFGDPPPPSVSTSNGTAWSPATDKYSDSLFTTPAGHNGVTFVAASGDRDASPHDYSGPYSIFPSASPNVISVGATDFSSSGQQIAASYSGGGLSTLSAPWFQVPNVTNSDVRSTPDVAFLGGEDRAFPIYDSYAAQQAGSQSAWTVEVGTSAAAPQFAGLIAIANEGRALNGLPTLDGPTQTLPMLYSLPSWDFNDITQNAPYDPSHEPYPFRYYAAGSGYDLVTGLGAPVAVNLVADLSTDTYGLNGYSQVGNGRASQIAAAVTANGDPELFAISAVDQQVYYQNLDAAGTPDATGTPTPNYFKLAGPGKAARIVVGTDLQGHAAALFAISGNEMVYELQLNADGSPNGGYQLVTGGIAQSIAVATLPDGEFELFAISAAAPHQVYYDLVPPSPSTANSGWLLAGGPPATQITVGHDASGEPEVYAITSPTSQVYELKFAANGGPQLIPGTAGNFVALPLFASQVAAASDHFGDPVLFAICSGRIDSLHLNSNGDVTLPSGFTAAPSLIDTGTWAQIALGEDAGGNPELFGINSADQQTYNMVFDQNGQSRSAFYLVRKGPAAQIAVTPDAAGGGQELFAISGVATPQGIAGNELTCGQRIGPAGDPVLMGVYATSSLSDPGTKSSSPLQATGGYTIDATAGGAISQQIVASFTDPAGTGDVAFYSATIDWGDGSSSSGTIVTDSAGGFEVLGAHEYATNGDFTIQVDIERGTDPDVAVNSQAIVSADTTPAPGQLDLTDAVYVIGPGADTVSADNGMLKNDSATSPLTVATSTVTGAQDGTFAFNADGSFTYTPTASFPGFDSTQVSVSDAQGHQGTATVTVLSQHASVVWKFYESVLDRAPDPGGLQFWTNYFNNGGNNGAMAFGFFESDELLSRVITGYYEQYLGARAGSERPEPLGGGLARDGRAGRDQGRVCGEHRVLYRRRRHAGSMGERALPTRPEPRAGCAGLAILDDLVRTAFGGGNGRQRYPDRHRALFLQQRRGLRQRCCRLVSGVPGARAPPERDRPLRRRCCSANA